MADQLDQLISQLVVEQGLASPEQVQQCLQEKARRYAQGQAVHLGSLMVEMNVLTAHQVKSLLALINQRTQAVDDAATMVDARASQMRAQQAPTPGRQTPSPAAAPSRPTDLLGPDTMAAALPGNDPVVGRMLLGKYRIHEKIGQGGMGAVYKAHHTKLDRSCAIKVLPRELADNPELLERFRLEAQATARLDQQNVVRIFDVDNDQGIEFIAMEFLEGNPLDKLMREKGKLPIKTALQIIKQAALGLAAAHKHNIIHRDIKPANLMLTKEGMIKVMDFGLARLVESSSMLSQTGQVMGTPHFMSPEQAEAEPVDHRTDVYALGVTLYYMVTGKTPFNAATPTALLLQVVKANARPAAELNPDVPAGVSSLIQRMMAREPDARFQSCEEVVAAIDQLIARPNAPIAHYQPPAEPLSKKQLYWIGGGIAGGVLLLLLAIFAMSGSGPSEEEAQAAQKLAAAEKAHKELLSVLARQSATPEQKLASCRSYLSEHGDSANASKVKELAKEWSLAVSLDRWKREFAQLASRVARLKKEGKPAVAMGLLQAFIERKPVGKVAAQARELLAGLERGPKPTTGPKPRDPKGPQLGRELARQQEIQRLRERFGKQRRDNDRSGARETLTQLEKLGARDLRSYRDWVDREPLPTRTGPKASDGDVDKAMSMLRQDQMREAEPYFRRIMPTIGRGSGPTAAKGRQLALRLGIVTLGHKRYRNVGHALRGVVENSCPERGPALLLTAAASFKSDDRQKGVAAARRAFNAGMPISEELVERYGLMPAYGDTLRLQSGEVLRGKLKQKTASGISFSYAEGSRLRMRFFRTAQVASIERNSPDDAAIGRVTTSGTPLEKLGLAAWLTMNGKAAEGRKLRRAAEQQLQSARRGLGLVCESCERRDPAAGRCKACGGKGQIGKPCGECHGARKSRCDPCGGDGQMTCRQCDGKGFMPPRRGPPPKGPPRPPPKCRACGGDGKISCRECRGSGKRRCRRCSGKGVEGAQPCPTCRGRQPEPCKACQGLELTPNAWTALTLGGFHYLGGDPQTAERYWRYLTGPEFKVPQGWRTWIERRLHDFGGQEYARKLR